MKIRDEFTLEEFHAMFAQAGDAKQYEVRSAYSWAMCNVRERGRK